MMNDQPERTLVRTIMVITLMWSMQESAVGVSASDEEETRQNLIAERFNAILEKNPRRGTAFDKVYVHHAERGTLDAFVQKYYQRASDANPQSDNPLDSPDKKTDSVRRSRDWMIVGLTEWKRGEEKLALEAFQSADRLDDTNGLPAYYAGLILMATGLDEKSAESLERAIKRRPDRTDLLEIFQTLGRVYQRMGRVEKALDVWNRLEQQFPNDERVQELIATTLLEEEAYEPALIRFEKLAASSRDRNRQLAFRTEVADIKIRLNRTDEAIAEFEQLLSQLNSDHWIYRDVRKRIEAVYLQTNDRDGLAAYYEEWMARHPEDLEAIGRLARVYASLGRDTQAIDWLERAVKIAPSRKDLRRLLIDRLLDTNRFQEAVAHFEQLNRMEPNNSDTIREWGRALLKDPSKDNEARREAAAKVWHKLIEAQPKDAVTASQYADLLRSIELKDAAIDQYRRAISLAPDATQYREYLGEYLHSLGQIEDALTVWKEIASEDRKTAANLGRLAEVLASFDYVEEAITYGEEACKLDSKDLDRQIKQADLLSRSKKFDKAIAQLQVVKTLVSNDEEYEAWLQRDLRMLKNAELLQDRILDVAAATQRQLTSLESMKTDGADVETKAISLAQTFYWLARAYEAEGQNVLAVKAISTAHTLAPNSTPIMSTAARLTQSQGELRSSAEMYSKLASIDRRHRPEYLEQLTIIRKKLGQRELALQSGRELLATAPNNPQYADFYSQICFQLGDVNEGLDVLRRSARSNSSDSAQLFRLASALIEHQHHGEAIDHLWQAMEKTTSIEDKLSIIEKLLEAHAPKATSLQVIERLKVLQRDRSRRREITLCLAHAYLVMNNLSAAQRELESLLSEETRDPVILSQLRVLAEKRNDFKTAAYYQRILWQVTQSKKDRYLLAQLMLKNDQAESAVELLTFEEGRSELTSDVLQLLDGLYEANRLAELITHVKSLRKRFPDNWELLYREGVAHAEDRPERAVNFFEKIISLDLDDNEPSLLVATQNTNAPFRAPLSLPLNDRLSKWQYIRMATLRPNRGNSASNGRGASTTAKHSLRTYHWIPANYAEARLGAWGWIVQLARIHQNSPELGRRLDQLQKSEAITKRALIDQIYVAVASSKNEQLTDLARDLAIREDALVDEKIFYLQLLTLRHLPVSKVENNQRITLPATPTPLTPDRLNEVIKLHRLISNDPQYGVISQSLAATVVKELVVAGRHQEADALLNECEQKATSEQQVSQLFRLYLERENVDACIRLLDTLVDRRRTVINTTNTKSARPAISIELPPLVGTKPSAVFAQSANANAGLLPPPMPPTSQQSTGWRSSQTNVIAAVNSMTELMNLLAKKQELEKMALAWKRHIQLKALSQQKPQSPSVQSLIPSINVSAGNLPKYMADSSIRKSQLIFLSDYFDAYDANLLRILTLSHSTSEKKGDIQKLVETEARNESAETTERVIWMFAYAHLLWWDEKTDDALGMFSDAIHLVPHRNDLRLSVAGLYEARADHKTALAMIDSISDETPDIRKPAEYAALRLASELKLPERTKLAASRLLATNLQTYEIVPLAQTLIKLEMMDEAESLLARAREDSQESLYTSKLLMDDKVKRNLIDSASVIAERIVAKTEVAASNSPPTGKKPARGNSTTSSTSNVNNVGNVNRTTLGSQRLSPSDATALRQAALTVLAKANKLTPIIQEREERLKESPNDERLISILMELHAAAGNQSRIDELKLAKWEIDLSKPHFRYAALLELLSQGKTEKALDHVKYLIEHEHDFIAARITDVVFRFEDKKQLEPLGRLLAAIDWDRNDPKWHLAEKSISLLLPRPASRSSGEKLFVARWKANPAARVDLLYQYLDDPVWMHPDLVADLSSLLVTSGKIDSSDEWWLFNRKARPTHETTELNSVLNRLLTILSERKELDSSAGMIEAKLKQTPEWTAGKVLLALVNLRRNHIAEGRDSLLELLPVLSEKFQNHPVAEWEIAQELSRHDESFELALTYFERALELPDSKTLSETSAPLGQMIVNLLIKRGRIRDTRRFILCQMPEALRSISSTGWTPTPSEIKSISWMGRAFRDVGCHIDAIQLYQKALAYSEGKTVEGYDSRTELQGSLVIAIKELDAQSLITHFTVVGDAPPQLDMQLFATGNQPLEHQLKSRWQPILAACASNPEQSQKLKSLLQDCQKRFPDDLVIHSLSGLLAFETKDMTWADHCVDLIIRFIEANPHQTPITKAPTPEDKPVQLEARAGLWVIAQKCLGSSERFEKGKRIATESLAAARRLPQTQFAIAIASQWLTLARAGDDKELTSHLEEDLETLTTP